MKSILIIYEITIDSTVFNSISVHKIDKDADMFVFANEQLLNKGFEKVFNTYFMNKCVEVKIKDTSVISSKMNAFLKHLIKQ